jgi:pSer/pThr/pTyr-binding forkhead associated (FHA) protein
MSYPNGNLVPNGSSPGAPEFNAQSHLGLAEILQMCCLNRRSGQLNFQAGGSSGFVYLQQGQVLHAVCGTVEGEEAIYRMLRWPPGSFSLKEDIHPHSRTIEYTWEQLLLEGARRADVDPERATKQSGPVVTVDRLSRTSSKGSLPRLTLILPDERPLTYELQAEYTYLGRAPENEISLAHPSVSSRHCIFILSGSDIVLRDLNSSNGTIVNGKTITETMLRPGDVIQIGVVEIRFEPGVRRPKLTQTMAGNFGENSELQEVPSGGKRAPTRTTMKLISPPLAPEPVEVHTDSAFLKGETISFDSIPKPEAPPSGNPILLILAGVVLLFLVLGAGYYFFILPH